MVLAVDYSSLSDQELSQMLKDYGVDVGPINMATRKSYERKLHKLKTGETMAPTKKHEPVADDDEGNDVSSSTPQPEEVTFKSSQPQPQQNYQPPISNVIHRTPEPTHTRQRRDPADIYSPHIDSRPSLNSAKKTTRSYDPVVDQPRPKSSESTTPAATGLPLWVKLSAVAVVFVLMYLIYTNMESNAATNIPKIPGKMEI